MAISSYAGEIQHARRGFDTDRFVKSISAGLLFRNGNVDVETSILNDNSSVVEHVRPISAFEGERQLNVLLRRNSEEIDVNSCLAPSHISQAG